MREQTDEHWNLAEMIDFEVELAAWDGVSVDHNFEKAPPPQVLKRWLEERCDGDLNSVRRGGKYWLNVLAFFGLLITLLFASTGFSAVWGILDRTREPAGMNVLWLLGITLFLPWLLFIVTIVTWMLRSFLPGGGFLAWIMRHLSARVLPPRVREVVNDLSGHPELAKAMGWRLAIFTQMATAGFHVGATLGLAVMVLFKQVGFFWETTTGTAMRSFLDGAVPIFAAPWQWGLPSAVPDVAGSELGQEWASAGVGWWPFCLLTLLVWGALPRLFIAGYARWNESRSLKQARFESPKARKLYRLLTQVKRGADPSPPSDGALVISLGAALDEAQQGALRPFFLQKLRVNPAHWETLGVLDPDKEQAAQEALKQTPAGVVLTAEGWSLAPRQLNRVLEQIGTWATGRRLILLVTGEIDDDLRQQWERSLDSFRGTGAGSWELFFTDQS